MAQAKGFFTDTSVYGKGGLAPPLSGTFGGPAVQPFGAAGGAWRTREEGLTRSGEAHSYLPLSLVGHGGRS